jgi:hypothetical protein
MDFTKLSNTLLGSRTCAFEYTYGHLPRYTYASSFPWNEPYRSNWLLDRLQITKR